MYKYVKKDSLSKLKLSKRDAALISTNKLVSQFALKTPVDVEMPWQEFDNENFDLCDMQACR